MAAVPFKHRALKALVAGWSAGITATLAAAGTGLATEVPRTGPGWVALASSAAGIGVVAAFIAARATYQAAANVSSGVTYSRDGDVSPGGYASGQ